jgi:alpha-amylase
MFNVLSEDSTAQYEKGGRGRIARPFYKARNRKMRMKLVICLAIMLMLLPLPVHALTGAVYEVFVASFYDSDGDGMGDLKGLMAKLPYIQSLGAKNIWMMPVFPSPSYHKYDTTDYCAIDPAYGTLADFDSLAAACKSAGMTLIMDLALNHTSSMHPWFLSACASLPVAPCGQAVCTSVPLCREHNPYVKYYHFTYGSGGHPVPGAEGWYYLGNFGPKMPDLDLDNPAVRTEIQKTLAFWIARGAGGFRLDATVYYYEQSIVKNTEFLAWLNTEAKAIDPGCYLVAEAWTDRNAILSMAASGIDGFFAFPFANTDGYLTVKVQKADGAGLAAVAADWQNELLKANPKALSAPFLSNHDMGRSAGMLRLNIVREKQAAAVYLLLPGTPYLYYGEEIALTGSGRDENKRLPMLWSASDKTGECLPPPLSDQAQRQKMGVIKQEADAGSLLTFYKRILYIRNACEPRLMGPMSAIDTGSGAVMAYTCGENGKTITVTHNLSDKETAVPVTWTGEMVFSYVITAGAPSVLDGMLTLPPHSGCVFE